MSFWPYFLISVGVSLCALGVAMHYKIQRARGVVDIGERLEFLRHIVQNKPLGPRDLEK